MSLNFHENPFSRLLRRTISLALIISGLSFTAEALERPSVFVDADHYSMKGQDTADLEGHVKIIRGDQQLTCDKAHINLVTTQLEASGNVILMTSNEFIKAERLSFNLNTKKGIVYNGFIQTGQDTIEGREIYKTGENQYDASDATYTSCTNCPPSWKISGSKVNATSGNYAYIKNPVVKVHGVPILWLPYMVIPIKTERQSGFLPPTLSRSNTGGTAVGLKYFWAMSESKDMTITGTNIEFRGQKAGLEYRYVVDKNSSGIFNGHFLNDNFYGRDSRYISPDPRYTIFNGLTRPIEYSVPRFGLSYDHHYELPENFSNNVSLTAVRDTNYIYDFPRDVKGINESALDNRISVSKNSDNSHASTDVSIYQNLLLADPAGENDAIHRVPEIRYTYLAPKIPGTRLLTRIDFDYLNLARAEKSWRGDITYDNGNPRFPNGYFRTGQRYIVRPELTYPIKFGEYLDLTPQVAYEEASYQFGYSFRPTTSRRYFRTTTQVKTRLSNVFGGTEHPHSRRYKHSIEPDVTYTHVPYYYQEEHPFFGASGSTIPHFTSSLPVTEFDNLQFDYRDRLIDRQLVTFGLTNKLIRKRFKRGQAEYREIVRHRLTQSFDIYNANEPPDKVIKQPWSEIRSFTEIKLDYFSIVSDVNYYPYQNIATNSSSVGLSDSKGNKLSLAYSQSFAIKSDPITRLPVGTVDVSAPSEAATVGATIKSKYLELAGALSYNLTERKFTSEVVYALIKPPGNCWGFALSYEKRLGQSDPEWKFSIPIRFGEGSQAFELDKPEI